MMPLLIGNSFKSQSHLSAQELRMQIHGHQSSKDQGNVPSFLGCKEEAG